jgi:hypothetical protein
MSERLMLVVSIAPDAEVAVTVIAGASSCGIVEYFRSHDFSGIGSASQDSSTKMNLCFGG